jgi:hypothetical protein
MGKLDAGRDQIAAVATAPNLIIIESEKAPDKLRNMKAQPDRYMSMRIALSEFNHELSFCWAEIEFCVWHELKPHLKLNFNPPDRLMKF